MKYEVRFTTQFKKDLKLAKKQNRDIDLLFEIIDKLANDEVLEPKFRDHNLTGDYVNFRECHVEPDWLLIYKKEADILVLLLQRVGSHSELF
ncbi:MAG: type II toxin-antitoxin system YafQ family toxin [Oscillospiraceae bacterium]|nr:type II toxin-antitoxin system YafQ family toxin [Oscillospiraceae bacterium]